MAVTGLKQSDDASHREDRLMALDNDEQDRLVARLSVEVETMDGDEWDALRAQLDAKHRRQLDEEVREWATDAIGDENWNSDG
jgi:hypothetical protein